MYVMGNNVMEIALAESDCHLSSEVNAKFSADIVQCLDFTFRDQTKNMSSVWKFGGSCNATARRTG